MARVEIYSADNCDYCRRAKSLLTDAGVEFEEFDIASDNNRQSLMDRLPRMRSIPQIFVNGEHIGGYEDLEILKQRGGFDNLK